MALRALRPTGNRILACDGSPLALPISDRYKIHWLSSGTAALALAILAAKANRPTPNPEIILPAYGCPDLVAAAQYAGVKAILVDIQADSPLYEYKQLEAAISDNTIAIVAATLLGVRGDNSALRKIIGARAITLIEDSAQWFPRHQSQIFFGDSVVLSFGRGKPINLLGGGALLTSQNLPESAAEHIAPALTGAAAALKYRLRVNAYNTLIQPAVYGLVEKLPFLHIGETAYHDLLEIAAIAQPQMQSLATNLRAFTEHSLSAQKRWRSEIADLRDEYIVDLTTQPLIPEDYALLRYPLLIQSKALRDRLYTKLRAHGLGASIMYAKPLAFIPGVSNRVKLFSASPNAEAFSERLLTLPTHDAVTEQAFAKTLAVFKDVLRSSNA